MTSSNSRSGGYTYPNKVELVKGGKPYFSILLKHIEKAERIIQLQTYIFIDDQTGRMIGDALKAAAKRGVATYLMLDGYASQKISSEYIKELQSAGVYFRFFEPLLKSNRFYFGRRLHHKVFVADDKYAMVGGINITDKYNDVEDKSAWLDFALLCEGPIAAQLSILCMKTWNGFIYSGKIYKPIIHHPAYTVTDELSDVRMRRNDWVRKKNQILRSYQQLFREAQQEIIILCSYFIPGRAIRKSLKLAARRGVTIHVIVAGMSDVPVAKFAERFLYAWLIRHNIQIYEYQKNILHGKVAVADKKIATIGSFNINDISTFASVELNLDVQNESFSKQLYYTLQEIIQRDCIHVNSNEKVAKLPLIQKFTAWLSYQFVRLIFFLFTFYFKQEEVAKKINNP